MHQQQLSRSGEVVTSGVTLTCVKKKWKKLEKNENFDFLFLLSNIIETSPEHIPVVWDTENRCLSVSTRALMTSRGRGVPAGRKGQFPIMCDKNLRITRVSYRILFKT